MPVNALRASPDTSSDEPGGGQARRSFAAARKKHCADVLAAIDGERWQALRAKWEADEHEYSDNYTKYLDLDRWAPQAVVVAMQAGLTEGPPRRVLDIGCGGGLLLRVCRHFGHDVVGIDVGNPMFMAMCEAFEVRCIASPIQPRQRLPEDLDGFDVVTAVSPKFYRDEKIPGRPPQDAWNDDDWDFFLADLASRMREGGTFFGKFNHNHDLSPRMLQRIDRGQRIEDTAFKFILQRGDLTC